MIPSNPGCCHVWAKASERTDEYDNLIVTFRCSLCGKNAERTFYWEEDI